MMSNKVYHLSSCSTCKRILNEINLPENTQLQDVKTNSISEKELDSLVKLSGSYESLFSKRAQLYKQRELKNKSLLEEDYKALILAHYTFLSRPVFVLGEHVFVGNKKQTIEEVKQFLSE